MTYMLNSNLSYFAVQSQLYYVLKWVRSERKMAEIARLHRPHCTADPLLPAAKPAVMGIPEPLSKPFHASVLILFANEPRTQTTATAP